MKNSRNNLVLKSFAILVVFVIVWSVIGYIQGGWDQAVLYGLIAGPIFAAGSIVLMFIQARRQNRSEKSN